MVDGEMLAEHIKQVEGENEAIEEAGTALSAVEGVE